MGMFMMGNGKEANVKEMEYFIQKHRDTKDNLNIINSRVEGFITFKMELYIKVISNVIRGPDKESIIMQMEIDMKDSGEEISNKERVFNTIDRVTDSKELGKRELR